MPNYKTYLPNGLRGIPETITNAKIEFLYNLEPARGLRAVMRKVFKSKAEPKDLSTICCEPRISLTSQHGKILATSSPGVSETGKGVRIWEYVNLGGEQLSKFDGSQYITWFMQLNKPELRMRRKAEWIKTYIDDYCEQTNQVAKPEYRLTFYNQFDPLNR